MIERLLIVLVVMAYFSVVEAALYDRGGGMIYDDVLDITWLQDANYAKTSGYDSDGKMTWEQAVAWAEGLDYGGYDDWRLPSSLNQDGSGPCKDIFGDPNNRDGDCVGSEMGHMFYTNMGVMNGSSILSSTHPNLNLFSNLQAFPYWSGTESICGNLPCAWSFWNDFGAQVTAPLQSEFYAWAVRDGDVAPVPTIPVLVDSVSCSKGIVTIYGSGFGSYVNTAGSGTKITDIDDSESCVIQSWTDTAITADCGFPVNGSIKIDSIYSSATVEVEGCKSSGRPKWWEMWSWWSSWSWARR